MYIVKFLLIFSDGEKRLKQDLRKTKALLRDAETVLQKMRGAEGTKATIKQLRNRVSVTIATNKLLRNRMNVTTKQLKNRVNISRTTAKQIRMGCYHSNHQTTQR